MTREAFRERLESLSYAIGDQIRRYPQGVMPMFEPWDGDVATHRDATLAAYDAVCAERDSYRARLKGVCGAILDSGQVSVDVEDAKGMGDAVYKMAAAMAERDKLAAMVARVEDAEALATIMERGAKSCDFYLVIARAVAAFVKGE